MIISFIIRFKMKKQLCNDEITRIIERENVITFKRKNDQKSSLKSQKDEEEEEAGSTPNEQNSFHRNTKRNMPLPQINREKKRLPMRASDAKPPAAYFEKEVRQRDILMLKNANNHLTNENVKLKTKNMNLEKEIQRLQKVVEEDPQKGWAGRQGRHTDSSSLKIVMKNLKKEVEELKKENSKIKTSIKFTTINELQVERDSILEQSQRLREMLEEQRNRCNFLKMNQQSASQLELKQLQDRNIILSRENSELKSKVNRNGEDRRGSFKDQEFEKNVSRQLFNARNALKEKQKEIEYLKSQIKKAESNSQQDSSLKVIQTHALQNSRSREIKNDMGVKQTKGLQPKPGKEKRLMSKSAQKYRTQAVQPEKMDECQSCKKTKQTNALLEKKLQEMKAEIEKYKQIRQSGIEDFSKNPLKPPSPIEIDQVKRFLIHRFKAHHLTIDEAVLHLLNIENQANLQAEISVGEFIEISMAEPFSILSDRYLQVFIYQMCYQGEAVPAEGVMIDESKPIKKKTIKANFLSLIGQYQLLNQNREDQMFIQIAQLITHYQQHIHKALYERRNTQNTVCEKDFFEFFKEIQLQPQYIDFMVSQIILESLDLDHLNIYNLFEIFYMPQQEEPVKEGPVPKAPGKNKFKIIETVVKEEDQEYEQSKSFLQSKQKSISRHEQDTPKELQIQEKNEQQEYEQPFQEQKAQNLQAPSPSPSPSPPAKKDLPEIEIENVEEQYVEDYEN